MRLWNVQNRQQQQKRWQVGSLIDVLSLNAGSALQIKDIKKKKFFYDVDTNRCLWKLLKTYAGLGTTQDLEVSYTKIWIVLPLFFIIIVFLMLDNIILCQILEIRLNMLIVLSLSDYKAFFFFGIARNMHTHTSGGVFPLSCILFSGVLLWSILCFLRHW